MPALEDFATWEPLLRLMKSGIRGPWGQVSGSVHRSGWRLSAPYPPDPDGRPFRIGNLISSQEGDEAMERVQDALVDDTEVPYVADFERHGKTILHLLHLGPAAETSGADVSTLMLVEDAVPEPWRRLPDPSPDAVPAPTADPKLLERTVRDLVPGFVPYANGPDGSIDEAIAAVEARLGVALPDELRAVYRVTNGAPGILCGTEEHDGATVEVVWIRFCELDEVHIVDEETRPAWWPLAAYEAAVTRPDDAVQGLVGSPGWIAFGDNGGGDRYVVDLTPGPKGHVGQIIWLDHESEIGGALVADSLTDMIVHGRDEQKDRNYDLSPMVAYIDGARLPSVEAAAHPDLEVLSVRGHGREGEPPLSLAPVFDCARLRTLAADPRVLADPLEIGRLRHLEYLSLAPEDWRVLLNAGAVPRGLLAAGFAGQSAPLDLVSLANELLALFGRPLITETVVEGVL